VTIGDGFMNKLNTSIHLHHSHDDSRGFHGTGCCTSSTPWE